MSERIPWRRVNAASSICKNFSKFTGTLLFATYEMRFESLCAMCVTRRQAKLKVHPYGVYTPLPIPNAPWTDVSIPIPIPNTT